MFDLNALAICCPSVFGTIPNKLPAQTCCSSSPISRPQRHMTLNPSGIVIDTETGEVTIPEGLALTDAAKAFWAAVQHVSGFRQPGFW
jgi:hypothetical protein